MDEEDPPREQTKEEKEDQESHFITKVITIPESMICLLHTTSCWFYSPSFKIGDLGAIIPPHPKDIWHWQTKEFQIELSMIQ